MLQFLQQKMKKKMNCRALAKDDEKVNFDLIAAGMDRQLSRRSIIKVFDVIYEPTKHLAQICINKKQRPVHEV